MATNPLLDYLERTFADAYRKEIDQEENIWRSLPFFAATLALQLTAVAQIRDWVTSATGTILIVVAILLIAAAVATMAALFFLALSVWPSDFRRVAREPAFRAYAEQVLEAVKRAAPAERSAQENAEEALETVKAALAEQYSLAVDSNRVVNETRAKWRARAGLATLGSVFTALVIVAIVVVANIGAYGKVPRSQSPAGAAGAAERVNRQPSALDQHTTAADDRRSSGVDQQQHDGAIGVGPGGGRSEARAVGR